MLDFAAGAAAPVPSHVEGLGMSGARLRGWRRCARGSEQAGEQPTDAIGKLFIALPQLVRLDGREN